jgi:hypothetical protein
MKSDFKHVVKESLREAFYTPKKLPTFKIVILGELYYVVISHNNNPKEKPYKMTLFKKDRETQKLIPVPKGTDYWKVDWDIDWEEMEYMLKNKKLPDRFIQGYLNPRYKNKLSQPKIIFEEMLKEALFGIIMKVKYIGCLYDALLCRNTHPNELPYRFLWFDSEGNDVTPLEHHDLDEQDIEFILHYKRFPSNVLKKFGPWGAPQILSITDKHAQQQPDMMVAENEALLFLENSVRELDLYIENKLPIGEIKEV